MMKKIMMILAVATAALLSACGKDSESFSMTPTEIKIQEIMKDFDGNVDMNAFLEDVRNGVWSVYDYDCIYTNGRVRCGSDLMGGSIIHSMMLLPDGTCRRFFDFDHLPGWPAVYSEFQWSIGEPAGNKIAFYDPKIEENAPTAGYDFCAARTALELLCYKDGMFVMKGMQPRAGWGGSDSEVLDYCMIVGRVVTDRAMVDKYLSYISCEQFKAEHPELFE